LRRVQFRSGPANWSKQWKKMMSRPWGVTPFKPLWPRGWLTRYSTELQRLITSRVTWSLTFIRRGWSY
jgi:hypothetical protein